MKWPIAAAAALAAVRISRITAGHIVYYIQYETAIGPPQLSRENLSVAQRFVMFMEIKNTVAVMIA